MGAQLGRSVMRIGSGILVSRILGLVREQVFAFLLGAGKLSDAFIVAFRIPNLLRDLFAEGALSQAFIPVFTGIMVNESREKAYAFANKVLFLLLIILGTLTALGYLFTVPLVQILMRGADPSKLDLTVRLTQITLPFLLLVSVAAIFMGMLNSQKSYTVPALAPAMFNIISILAGILALLIHADPIAAVIIWTVGALLGGLGQMLIQIPALLKLGFKIAPKSDGSDHTASVRKLLTLMGPSVIGVAAMEINIFINTMLATSLGDGPVTWLNYAFRLIQLPIGLFGVAIGTINIVNASQAAARNDLSTVKESLSQSLKLNFFLTLTATAGLITLGPQIVSILFEHGKFTATDTQQTYQAILFYCIGLFAYSGVKVTAPVFFALSAPKLPLFASLTGILANIIISLTTYQTLGIRGLALGTAVAALVNFSLLLIFFRIKTGGLSGHKVTFSFLKSILVSLLMGGMVFALLSWDPLSTWMGLTFLAKLIATLLLFLCAIFLVFTLGFLLRMDEARNLLIPIARFFQNRERRSE